MFIVFEGIDGCGKTTQANLLAEWLRSKGRNVVLSKEPTTGVHGQVIRALAGTGVRNPELELKLFIKDRKIHVEEVIMPALKRGDIVILDRYYYSNMAYQGPHVGYCEVAMLNREFAEEPDLVIFPAISPYVAMSRISARIEDSPESFETHEDLEIADEVFTGLWALQDQLENGAYWHRIDGSAPVNYQHDKIKKIVKEHLHSAREW